MLGLALLSSLSGVDASGNVVDCGGGFTAGDNTVSLADWFVSTALFPCLSKSLWLSRSMGLKRLRGRMHHARCA